MPPSVARAELPMHLAQAIKNGRSHRPKGLFSDDCCLKITRELPAFCPVCPSGVLKYYIAITMICWFRRAALPDRYHLRLLQNLPATVPRHRPMIDRRTAAGAKDDPNSGRRFVPPRPLHATGIGTPKNPANETPQWIEGSISHPCQSKAPHNGGAFDWRRRRDSNPR